MLTLMLLSFSLLCLHFETFYSSKSGESRKKNDAE